MTTGQHMLNIATWLGIGYFVGRLLVYLFHGVL